MKFIVTQTAGILEGEKSFLSFLSNLKSSFFLDTAKGSITTVKKSFVPETASSLRDLEKHFKTQTTT